MSHWHRLGERCSCGHLTAPARFYWKNEKEVSQEQAEKAYLDYLKENMPERYEKLVRNEIPNNVTRQRTVLPSRPSPRPKGLRRGRPKKYTSQAERQKAYRGRQ